jgi:hypothetical protein
MEPITNASVRNNTIHVFGTDDMSSADILAYFAEFPPSHIEWINDSCCNLVWNDEFTVKRALHGLGKPVEIINDDHDEFDGGEKGESVNTESMNEGMNEGMNDNPIVDYKSVGSHFSSTSPTRVVFIAEEDSVTDLFQWRAGPVIAGTSDSRLLFRYASSSDLKKATNAHNSKYYEKYGREYVDDYDHGKGNGNGKGRRTRRQSGRLFNVKRVPVSAMTTPYDSLSLEEIEKRHNRAKRFAKKESSEYQ